MQYARKEHNVDVSDECMSLAHTSSALFGPYMNSKVPACCVTERIVTASQQAVVTCTSCSSWDVRYLSESPWSLNFALAGDDTDEDSYDEPQPEYNIRSREQTGMAFKLAFERRR